jgi:hypothetical protein
LRETRHWSDLLVACLLHPAWGCGRDLQAGVSLLFGIAAGAATLAARGVNQTVDLAVAALDVGT